MKGGLGNGNAIGERTSAHVRRTIGRDQGRVSIAQAEDIALIYDFRVSGARAHHREDGACLSELDRFTNTPPIFGPKSCVAVTGYFDSVFYFNAFKRTRKSLK
jgi:hypothetical protein